MKRRQIFSAHESRKNFLSVPGKFLGTLHPFFNSTGIYFESYKKMAVGGALRLGATFGAIRVRVIAPLKATPLRIILTQT